MTSPDKPAARNARHALATQTPTVSASLRHGMMIETSIVSQVPSTASAGGSAGSSRSLGIGMRIIQYVDGIAVMGPATMRRFAAAYGMS